MLAEGSATDTSTKTLSGTGNGAGATTTLRRKVISRLRLAGLHSIRAGIQAVMHDVRAVKKLKKSPVSYHAEDFMSTLIISHRILFSLS